MVAGLQFFSDNSVTTVDGEHFNYEFTRKGSTTGNLNFTSSRGGIPMVFIRPSNAGFGRGLLSLGGNNYRYEWTGNYSYWIFEPPLPPSGSGAGIQVFDANGKMVFTGDIRPLKITSVVSYTRAPRRRSLEGYYVGVNAPKFTNPVATVNMGGSHFAYAPALPKFCGLDTITLDSYDNHNFVTRIGGETFLATSTGFVIGERKASTVNEDVLESGYYPPYSEGYPSWISPPGIITVADISGL